MILVHLRQTWPKIMKGEDNAERATLNEWAQLPDDLAKWEMDADVIVGVYDNVIRTAYDVDTIHRNDKTGRWWFTGHESQRWAHLVGAANPGKLWGEQGYARSVQRIDTRDVATMYPPPGDDVEEPLTAVVGGFVLTVSADDPLSATVVPASGGRVTVAPRAS